MDLLAAILRQIWALLLNPTARRRGGIEAMMADAEQKLADHILERALAMKGRTQDRHMFECRLVWRGDTPDFIVIRKPGYEEPPRPENMRPAFHPRMLRRLPSRRPRLPNRFNKRRTTCILRMEHRRNRRSDRTFIHAAPIAPRIREPRVLVPPW